MQSVGRRLSEEVDLEEDQSGGVGLYKKGGAHASVVASWDPAGFHTGSVVVVATVVVIVEASHKHQEEYKWDLWTRSELLWVCFLASATSLVVAGTRHRQSPHGGNCYLEGWSALSEGRKNKNKARITTRAYNKRIRNGQLQNRGEKNQKNLHSGFCSSHFFFLLRHVRHPVFVRLLKFLFLFLASD